MKNAVVTFLLVVLVEAATAVATYLKDRLMEYLRRSGDDNTYNPDFACC
ncbi:hypothetical protein [Paraburkholderia hospita]|nr:hypothetical protein [Paraburkholderia hospita]SKC49163.1 hypothetical protein SAMN05446934_0264 [Paraburkholderia hospita]